MKTKNPDLFQELMKETLIELTQITNETLAVPDKDVHPKFTVADLYRIQRQKRTFATRRQLVV